jgi:shikimate kinase
MKNIVLVGFMGTGKSCVGQFLARQLGWQFIDLDEQVEQTVGMSIAEYFEKFGEAAFRDQESAAVAAVAAKSQVVLATGGGVVLRQKNIDRLKTSGILVCLSASENEIVARTQGDRLRPLLNRPDRVEVIRELLALRQPQYRQADYWIETDGKPLAAVAATILQILREEGQLSGDNPGESGQSKL